MYTLYNLSGMDFVLGISKSHGLPGNQPTLQRTNQFTFLQQHPKPQDFGRRRAAMHKGTVQTRNTTSFSVLTIEKDMHEHETRTQKSTKAGTSYSGEGNKPVSSLMKHLR